MSFGKIVYKDGHIVWLMANSAVFVECRRCGYPLNDPVKSFCDNCGCGGIRCVVDRWINRSLALKEPQPTLVGPFLEKMRPTFCIKNLGEENMRNCFADAVDRLPIDRPKQYVFTVEVVLHEKDLHENILAQAEQDIQSVGSFEIVEVEELLPSDPRCINFD